MKIFSYFILIFQSFLFLNINAVELKNIKVFTSGRFPPIVIVNNGKLSGILGDFLMESTKNIATYKVESDLPYSRMLQYASLEKNSLIVPVAWSKENQNKFKWIVKVYDEGVYFITIKPNPPITKLSNLKKLVIGSTLVDPFNPLIKKMGVVDNRLQLSIEHESVAKKLMAGRVDAWAVSMDVANYLFRKNHFDPNLLQLGMLITSYPIYIATSIHSDDWFVKKLSDEMNKFKKTPRLKEILEKYPGST